MRLPRKVDYEWWFRPRFLQPWGRPARALFAGPWVGEFGWELVNWQGFVRKLSRRYETTIVCCRAGHEALYADFATGFVTHAVRGTAVGNEIRGIENPAELERVAALVPDGADHLRPIGYHPFARQELVRFGKARPDLAVDILFHPRSRTFGTDRNWPREKWDELLARLSEAGYSLGCIGVAGGTLSPRGAFRDFRDLPLSETVDVIASARLVLGPSSGPMHLASFCGTPHLVWTDALLYARSLTNRSKYERHWNPFGTPALVLDDQGFDPSVDSVLAAAESYLRDRRPSRSAST